MRITVCGSVAVISTFLAVPAFAQARPAAAPPGAVPPAYGPPPPGYGPPPPGYYPQPAPADQERTAFNGIYVEGLGPGFFYSFNYDRIISDVAVRIGIGYISLSASSANGDTSAHAYWLSLPFDVNYVGIGSKKHIFELGAGGTIVAVGAGASSLGVDSGSGSTTLFYGHLNVGYRMQPPAGGFMLRTGISPIIGKGVFLPWPYIAIGATF